MPKQRIDELVALHKRLHAKRAADQARLRAQAEAIRLRLARNLGVAEAGVTLAQADGRWVMAIAHPELPAPLGFSFELARNLRGGISVRALSLPRPEGGDTLHIRVAEDGKLQDAELDGVVDALYRGLVELAEAALARDDAS